MTNSCPSITHLTPAPLSFSFSPLTPSALHTYIHRHRSGPGAGCHFTVPDRYFSCRKAGALSVVRAADCPTVSAAAKETRRKPILSYARCTALLVGGTCGTGSPCECGVRYHVKACSRATRSLERESSVRKGHDGHFSP
jgi:hypothetical protein